MNAEQLERKFDALASDIDELLKRHRRVKAQRDALLEASKRALPYLASHIAMTRDEGPGDRIVYDLLEAAIEEAEAP